MPAAKPRPGTLPPGASLDLGDLLGSAWSDFRIDRDGLHNPMWRRPFAPGELKAQFWQLQQLAHFQHLADQAKRDADRAEARAEAAEKRAHYYRSQLSLEARSGAMLARIFDPQT